MKVCTLAFLVCLSLGASARSDLLSEVRPLAPLKVQLPERGGWRLLGQGADGFSLRNFDNAHAHLQVFKTDGRLDEAASKADALRRAEALVHALPEMQIIERALSATQEKPYPCIRAQLLASMKRWLRPDDRDGPSSTLEYRVLVCRGFDASGNGYVAGSMFEQEDDGNRDKRKANRGLPQLEARAEAERFLRSVSLDSSNAR